MECCYFAFVIASLFCSCCEGQYTQTEQLFHVSEPHSSEFETIIKSRNSTNTLFNGIEKVLKNAFLGQVLNVSSALIKGLKPGDVTHNPTHINKVDILVDTLLNAVSRMSDSIDNEACKSDIKLYFRDLKAGVSWAMKSKYFF